MPTPEEPDFPPGHPGRCDFDPKSAEAIEWRRRHYHPKGERDWPVDHPKASDTPGNNNGISWVAGVDPAHPEREEHTGRTPEQAAALREHNLAVGAVVQPTEPRQPTIAPQPPAPGSIQQPAGQPGG